MTSAISLGPLFCCRLIWGSIIPLPLVTTTALILTKSPTPFCRNAVPNLQKPCSTLFSFRCFLSLSGHTLATMPQLCNVQNIYLKSPNSGRYTFVMPLLKYFLQCFQEKKKNNETDRQNYINQRLSFEVTMCASFWEFSSGVIFVLFFFLLHYFVTH